MKLQSKIISTVILIFVLLNMIFLFIFFKREESDEIKRLNEKIEKTSELLNQVNSGPLYDYDTEKLETNLQSFLKDSEIYSLSLSEINGGVFLFYGKEELIPQDDIIKKRTDLFFNGENIGVIEAIYTKTIIKKRLENSLRQLLGFLFIITLVISLVLFLLLRKIIHPISELTRLSTEMVEGNLETEININRTDELGTLANSFMKMKASINQKIDYLQIENINRRNAVLRSFRQQEAIFHIASKEHFNKDWNEIAKLITEYSAVAMNVGRVSIWIYSKDQLMINCLDLHTLKEKQHMKEESLLKEDYPLYFAALKEEKVISVADVLTDGRTSELTENYLIPFSIISLIDAPIRVKGKVVGVICFESVSEQKNWTKDEEIFSERIAQQISTFLVESERKKQEREIGNLRNYLVNIIDSMPSEIITVDSDCLVTQWNKKAENRIGINSLEAIGKNIFEVYPRLIPDENKILSSIKTGEIIYDKKREKITDKGFLYEDLTIYPLTGHDEEGAVIRIDDTSDIIRMEEMMIQSEKMLSVGGLAAGMAHEINNPLAGMMQTAGVMANRLGEKSDLQANVMAAEHSGITVDSLRQYMIDRDIPRMIDTIREAGHRIAEIVENMLSFSRKSDGLMSSYSINTLIDKTLELAATDYDLKKQYDFKSIEIVKEYNYEIPQLHCEGAKIQQVILNILRNGAEAMQEVPELKPRFTVRTKYEKETSMICFEIEDNGPGMTNDIRKRIFEPFFTTKPVGVGTGLGLSVSYFIITENHKGKMSVKSLPGNGCNFIIQLPLGQVL